MHFHFKQARRCFSSSFSIILFLVKLQNCLFIDQSNSTPFEICKCHSLPLLQHSSTPPSNSPVPVEAASPESMLRYHRQCRMVDTFGDIDAGACLICFGMTHVKVDHENGVYMMVKIETNPWCRPPKTFQSLPVSSPIQRASDNCLPTTSKTVRHPTPIGSPCP